LAYADANPCTEGPGTEASFWIRQAPLVVYRGWLYANPQPTPAV